MIKHFQIEHFDDDTNLLNIKKSPKRLNKLINIDLKTLENGLTPIKYL